MADPTQLPTWYDQLSSDIGSQISGGLSRVNQLTQNWYDQPLVAGLTPGQQALIDQSAGVAGQWQTPYNTAAGTAASAQTPITSAGGSFGSMTSGLPDAKNLWGQAQTGLTGAGTATGTAATYDPTKLQQHLNPYLDGVLNEIQRRSTQNLMQDVIPGINQSFTGSGLFGSSRMTNKFLPEAIAKSQREMLGTQATAGLQAYNQAAQDYYNWGQLGVQGAGQQANIASKLGDLGTAMATTPANIYGQQGQNYLSQAGAFGTLSGLQANQALAAQQQRWADLEKQYGLEEAERKVQQEGLTEAYKDWFKEVSMPYELMGGLSKALQTTIAPYTGAVSSGGSSDLGDVLSILRSIYAGGTA